MRVRFTVSTGFVGSGITEEFDLVNLGIIKENYPSEAEFHNAIEEAYDEWLDDKVKLEWDFI